MINKTWKLNVDYTSGETCRKCNQNSILYYLGTID